MSESLSIWLSGPYIKEGLEKDAGEIGNIMAITGIPQLIFQVVLYPLILNKFGDLQIIVWSGILNIPVFLLFPLAHELFSVQDKWMVNLYLIVV